MMRVTIYQPPLPLEPAVITDIITLRGGLHSWSDMHTTLCCIYQTVVNYKVFNGL